jgi:hypothetical protein
MLVLSRKSNQALIIDHDVVVTVVEIGDDFVRLSIESPDERDIGRRYPQALEVPAGGDGRPVVVTLSLRHAAVLDRFRRQMSDGETTPPTRDAALASLLDVLSDDEEGVLSRLTGRAAAP